MQAGGYPLAMCRLFGFRSNVPSRAHRSLVEAENALARQARTHRDGWGIGYFIGEEAYILKSDAGAAEDERFKFLSRRLQSHTFVVHVRRATRGSVDYLNSHPFRHGSWIFAHNGTIFDFDRLRDRLIGAIRRPMVDLIFGSTDSEPIFYYLLSALAEAGIPDHGRGPVDVEVASVALARAVGRLYRWAEEVGANPPILNFILTNGRVLFAQRAGLELYLASQKITCGDFATCAEPDKVCMDVAPPLDLVWGRHPPAGALRRTNHLLVASEPIGEEDIWEEIPEGFLVMLDEDFRLFLRPPPDGFRKCPSPPAPPPRPRMRGVGLDGRP